MKKSGERTHPCRSPAATKQTSDQEYSNLTAVTGGCQHRNHATLPKVFHEEPGRMLSWSRQNMWRRLISILPRFLKNLLESEIICSVVLWWDENRIGHHSGLIQLFRGIFL